MTLIINQQGNARALHNDAFPFHRLGKVNIKRFSRVEWDRKTGLWNVIRKGKVLFSHALRQRCLTWEKNHFATEV